MSTHNLLGIILRQADYREADQLFNIYTDTSGKIMALGRGTKKVSSKLNCQLQSFSVINLMIAPGKNFDHIAGADIQHNFLHLKTDFKKSILACFALELVDVLTKTGEPDSRIYSLLFKYLSALDQNNFTDSEWQVIRHAFIIKLLTLLGLAPGADIMADAKKLNAFLDSHLDFPLNTEKFISKMIPV
ncbi:MAG: DNA repair protein RecO [Candidatus Buchananbacteria bacterium]|nr:DNA repair protein RecO [Candidatus Buchananbacteria bacterium]